ncbi:MAG: sodium:solute symporter family protein [Lachnospiraceae bacterium]|nr:sodium:solute symporter family protein [Lachnospiraceae bacterium]
MSPMTYAGLAIAVLLIAGLAIFSGTQVKKDNGKGNGTAIVTGVIMGTLVGGSSTVGTAQLAYNYGMSAWWFTLGAGIGCLILALLYVKPLRAEGKPTLVGMIAGEYGKEAGLAASILNSVGTFINIISQLLAASAVILVVFPAWGTLPAVIVSAIFMALYVIFGGTKGAGMVGILKTVLLYGSMIICGLLALRFIGGVSQIGPLMSGFSVETGRNFASVFARGLGKDLGACLSLIFGVLTTQTYAQAVLTAKSDGAGRAGALISAVLIPPLGICGILVGLYMRTVTDPAAFAAKTALTEFTLKHSGLPGIVSGIVLGALFIASVGTGAGLALGISNVVNRDIVKRFTHTFDDEKKSDMLGKVLIIVILAGACCLSTGSLGDTILNFAFMSMGLRGATVFAPLCFLIWAKGKVAGKWALASIIAGPVVVLLFGTVPALQSLLHGWDSLFPGIIAALVIMAIGLAARRKKV